MRTDGDSNSNSDNVSDSAQRSSTALLLSFGAEKIRRLSVRISEAGVTVATRCRRRVSSLALPAAQLLHSFLALLACRASPRACLPPASLSNPLGILGSVSI
jgi:hypothetical protein